ncbi:MAG: hypothetical protein H5U40_12395 [Polyangiaceae bacterium]|nr:hypothetical protein [Polyangiaceae bacterium]
MTHADSVPSSWDNNARDVPSTHSPDWSRPSNPVVTSYSQPWDDHVPEELYRDASWRAADAKDLIALAAWGIPVVIALTTAALL